MEIKNVRTLARTLMDENGLDSWKFKFDSAKRRLGQCSFRDKRISLSRTLAELNSEEQVKDTILHEIAHALCPLDFHSEKWKRKARELGCSSNVAEKQRDIIMPHPNYRARCGTCGYVSETYRKKKKEVACGICCKKFNNNRYDSKFKLKFVKVKR